MEGVMELRVGVASKLEAVLRRGGGSGSRGHDHGQWRRGAYCAIQAIVGQGDEAIVFDPAYDSPRPGRAARRWTLHSHSADAARLSLRLGSRGARPSRIARGSSSSIRRTTRRSRLRRRKISTGSRKSSAGGTSFVLSDEVYEHVTYDGRKHASDARRIRSCASAALRCSRLAKRCTPLACGSGTALRRQS